MPPVYGNILRISDNLTYLAQRILVPKQSLARKYSAKDTSNFPATGTTDPGDPNHPNVSAIYRRLQQGGFADWGLQVEGAVRKPGVFSLEELKKLPSRTQITKHICGEG